jgi:hypothetical protein
MTEEPVDGAGSGPPPVGVEETTREELAAQEVPAQEVTAPVPAAEIRSPARSHGLSLAITRLIQSLWLGSGAFLLLAASAAFGAAGNTTDAANVVGAILTRWHYIALFAPLLLLFLEWRRSRPAMLVILFVAILLASFQALLDTRIRMIRLNSFVPISSLSPDDPVRRHFGFLHGMSSLFLVGQVIAAGAAVATREAGDL